MPDARVHRDWEVYDQLFHTIRFEPGSLLEKLFNKKSARVNTVHHQAIKHLGKDLIVEARAEEDGIIEAIRLKSDNFVFAFQWHPEFQDPNDISLLNCRPILEKFLKHATERRDHASNQSSHR